MIHLLPLDFTLPTSAPPCRVGMESRRRHSRSILPLRAYRPLNRVSTASAQLVFNRSIPLNMENGPTNMNQLIVLPWCERRIMAWWPTIQSLMADRYNAFSSLDCVLTFVNASRSQTLETRSWFFN